MWDGGKRDPFKLLSDFFQEGDKNVTLNQLELFSSFIPMHSENFGRLPVHHSWRNPSLDSENTTATRNPERKIAKEFPKITKVHLFPAKSHLNVTQKRHGINSQRLWD